MKINEINQPKNLNEGTFMDLLLGPELAGKYKKTDRHAEAERLFLDDFIDDATVSLNNGIKSGLVDPKLTTSTTGAAPAEPVDPSSIKPTAPGKPATGASGAAAYKAQQQTSQNINNYVRGAAQAINKTTDKNQKIALAKELVNTMADRQGTPEWNNAVATVQQIIRRSGLDSSFANAAINNLKTGKTMSEAWRIYFANMLLESVGITWEQIGLCVLKEGTDYYVADKKYAKLNYIFESIVETDGAQSISDYMTDWFDLYMQGVDWRRKQSIVMPAIKDVEKTYKTDLGKAALEKLGRLAFALSGPAGQPPAGAKDIKPAAPAAPAAPNKRLNPDQLAADLASLKPKEREEVLNKVKAATK